MVSKGVSQPKKNPSSLSESQLRHQPRRPERKAVRKSGAQARKTVPDPLAVGPSAAVRPQCGPRGVGSGFSLQEGSEVKHNQYCQQQDCQVSTDNILTGRRTLLIFGFCGKQGPGRMHVTSRKINLHLCSQNWLWWSRFLLTL